MIKSEYRRITRFVSTIASSYGLSDNDLAKGGVYIKASKDAPSLFRYPIMLPEFRMVGFGFTTAIVASDEYLQFAKSKRHSVAEWFSGATLAEISSIASNCEHRLGLISHKFVAQSSIPAISLKRKPDFLYRQFDGGEISTLYDEARLFRNALSYGERPTRPDWRAVSASDDYRVVGVAGASEDAEGLYQIGVDVISEYRGLGIGTTLVSMLAKSIIEDDGVPFYSASSSNIISQRLCLAAGFVPVCVESYSYDHSRTTRENY